ncbi:MAG: amino acid adenylation domain-containing protein, partial [Acidobacteriota bacterium]
YPPGLDFVAAFFGCLYAGAVAVPAYPPRSARGQPRLRSIAADCGASAVLTTSTVASRESLVERVPELSGARWLATDDLDESTGSWQEPHLTGTDPAFLQYTSGSTAEPKGVVVTHGNLVHNEEVIRRSFGQSESSVVVGWLPLYHDMGLIGNVLQPLWCGGEAILMSPLAFLQRPRRWLEAISRYRATTSGGPNFSYDLCLRKIKEADRQGLDLSSWRVAFSGAEPVRSATMERFAEAFAPYGFRREAFYPCYGLAEATLFVTGGDPGEPFHARPLDPEALAENRVSVDPEGRELVSCGRPAADPAQRLLIVDPSDLAMGAVCPPDRIGEVWISGPGVAAGYWNRPEETARSFGARLADGDGPFLRTGDLGFVMDGELFVAGRLKDLIILRGRNLYPQDVELTAERSHPALRPGCGAAFGVERDGEERLVVVQEVESAEGLEAMAGAIRQAVAEEHEAAVDDVVLVRRNTVPKTSSGKIQRRACRALYLSGSLSPLQTPKPERQGGGALSREAGEGRGGVFSDILMQEAARVARTSRIDPTQPLLALGLDSLGAVELQSRLASRLGVLVPVARILEGASLAELAEEIRTRPEAIERTASVDLAGEHPLSAGQRALWLAERLAPESALYNLASAARIRGPLDTAALERAFAALARRHPALRTTFTGDPQQRVHDELAPDFRVGPFDRNAEAFRPFDLERGPLVRVRVRSISPDEHELLLVVHHLVSDFWSLTLLVRELAALYRQEELPAPTATYLDFVRRQEETLAGPRGEELWDYWRRQLAGLAGELPALEIPTDRPRPRIQGFSGGSRSLAVDGSGALALAGARGATLHMLLTAAFQALLHRYTRQDEILLGSPAAGRSPGLEDVVGYFVNPLVLRASFADDPGFADLLARVRTAALGALEHQDFPFPVLVERLRPERDPGRSPVFQAMLVLQRSQSGDAGLSAFALGEAGARMELAGLDCESLDLAERRVPFDLMLMASESEGRIELSLQYVSALFDGATVERMLGHLANLLGAAAASPEARISEIDLLSEAERRQIEAWASGPAIEASHLCLHELIEAQAARTPDRIALVVHGSGPEEITYAELAYRAEALAGRLRSRGVGPEVRVAVCAERTPSLVVALLAVLKAGGAYVPIDPAYPAERRDFMLADSGAALLLTGEELDGPDEPALRRPVPGNLAYLIYTSGSTGRPKGVAIEHRSAAAFARWARQVFSDEELSGVLAATSICFDLSVFELFVPLCWGGTVILADNALALPQTEGVRLVNTVPSAMAELVRSGGLPGSVITVNLAGEPLTRELADAIPCKLLNLYGPSEDTTYSTFTVVGPEGEPTIGRPVAGTRAWLVDAGLRPVPPGLPGELCLAGEGLARGYLGRPDLTAERFVPDPFGPPGTRLYRTGDLARFRPDGEIRFLGRIDHQVKIRGFRVEIGEVEAALRALPAVRDAVVIGAGDRLNAFVVGPVDPVGLREELRRTLPEFMVPAVAVLDALPLTPNGKVDRKALARLAPGAGWQEAGEAPRDETEEALAAIFAEVLGIERVGVHDDFFALGGHSLLAVRAQSRIRERLGSRLGLEVPLGAFFHSPTVARLRASLAPVRNPLPPIPARPEGRTRFPLSFAQERLWFLQRIAPESAAYHLAGAARLQGPLDVDALRRAWDGVVRRQEVLRSRIREVDGRPVLEVVEAGVELKPADGDVGTFARRPFDLENEPPVRAALVPLGPESHLLVLVLHHVAADEGSLDVLLHDLAAGYEGLALAEPPFQVADHAAWQRGWLQGEELESRLAWWEERLAGLASLELPTDRPRPAIWSGHGATATARLDADPLSALARREGSTLFMALLAAFQALLGRYTGQEDVAVGCPVSGRDRRELEGLVGLFVNTLVLRADLTEKASGEPGFRGLLRQVRDTTVAAQERADLPFELLVDRLRPERSLDRNPLFGVTFALHRPPAARRVGALDISVEPVSTGTAKFDLSLFAAGTADGLELSLEHAADLFETATAGRLLGHLASLIREAVADPERSVWELPILDPEERTQLLVEWGSQPQPVEAGLVHEMFEEQARLAPGRLAVAAGDGSLTYGELDRRAEGWARRLAELGVGPETPVALWIDRSAGFVTAALAVLKAGGAYVPIDPGSPRTRLLELLGQAGIRHLMTDRSVEFEGEILRVDGAVPDGAGPGVRVDGRNLAYAIFTSGSTGAPKAVAVEHAALANLVGWHRREYAVTPEDRATQIAGLGFDAAVWEIWPCLAAGASLHIPDEATRTSPAALVDWMAAEGVTLAFLPTPLAELAVARPRPEGLRLRALLTGGDRLHRAPDSSWNLVNHYGPTENTVVATSAGVEGEGTPPIGRPIGNVRTYVVDARLRPVPAGVPGELLLGGLSLARGYLGRPDLTAERFVADPLGGEAGERLYRTGDLVRYLPDGRIDFLGRIDQQIKVQGFRIEPAEVEAALNRHPLVMESAVRTWDGGSLAAYIVGEVDAAALREDLRNRLPAWMVPATFTFLDVLPLTPNGKVDRRALPKPERAAGFTPARNETERRLAEIWSEVLGGAQVGVLDNFFDLGGRSLLAIEILARVRNAFGVELPPRTLFESPTIAELAEAVAKAGADEGPALVPVGRAGVPASFAQQRLWFLDRLEPGSPVYNLPTRVRLQGPLDPAALRRSLTAIVGRHDALRTTFTAKDGEPVQVVHPPGEADLPVVDLAGFADPMAEAERIGALDAAQPFDLERGPLLRATLLRLGPDDHVLLLTVHHIVWDGWSLNVFIRELSACYRGQALPGLAVQYADYSEWQRRRLQGEGLERHLAYWRERLAGAPAALDLPTDRPRPPFQTWRGASERIAIDARTAAAVRELARREGSSVFMTLLAAFTAVLARCARQLDVVVGTPTANRERVELEPLLGFFANSLVLRVDFPGDATFRNLLARVRGATLGAYSHQEVPFEKLVEALKPERNLGQNPIYQVTFALEDSERPALDLPGVTATPLVADSGTAKFDLALYMEDRGGRGGRITGLLEYNRDLFERATAARLLARFSTLLESAVAEPDRPVLDLPLLDGSERHWLLYEANDTDREPAWSPFVHRWFERRAAERPGAPAVSQVGQVGTDRRLTYGELDRRANQLAHRLRALGVGPETRVAVAVERSPELIVALLGILKAGGCYVPLDPAYPADRLAFMLRDCQAPVLLTQPHLADTLPETQAAPLLLDPEWQELAGERTDAPETDLLPENLAYMIYTSGSTGRPKGTMIRHDSFASYTEVASRAYGVGPEDRVLQFCSISFDISLEEIVPCLALGGELVMRNDAMLESVATFLDVCRERSITMMSLPTAYWHDITARLDEIALPPSLRLVIIAGERALPERLVAWRRHAPERPRLINTFGLTESTIISTVCDLTVAKLEGMREVPIGRAMPDSTIYLLDRNFEPVPAGVPGEVFLGGRLLARGYFGRPDLTADRFQPHPHPSAPGERVYRTGDLARALWDGEMEFLGRGDHQVKLRGYRIELGEIETAMLRLPQVDAAVVLAQDEPKRLVSWVVPAPGLTLTSAELRAALREALPDYMLPAAFVFLEALPLTPNGKVDRAALPKPEASGAEVAESYVAPRDEAEQTIARVWKEVLGLDRVGIYDNFFDLGGHSLLLIQVHERLKRELGADLPMVELFKHSTVDALARRLSRPKTEAQEPAGQALKQKAQERVARSQAASQRDRFLKARGNLAQQRPAAPAPAPRPSSAPAGPDPEIRASHARLSRASAAFLEYALVRPEVQERRSFELLAAQSAFAPFPLHPWPVFVDRGRIAEHERVAVGLSRLIRSLPKRVFGNDPERVREFYGLDTVDLAKSMLEPPTGIDSALGRGDFLDTRAGLQCLEFNMVSHLGGWQAPLWAEACLRVPVIQEFLRREGLRVECRNTIDLLFSHVVGEARRTLPLNGELNVAFVVPDDLAGAVQRDFEAYLDATLRQALGRDTALHGRATLRRSAELAERDGRLYAGSERIHAVVEAHDGGTAAPAARCFKAGSLNLYNAAVRTVLTDKRNLALLSELAGSGLFTPDERGLIERHVPWTRRLAADTFEDALARREELVVKRARAGQGRGVHAGRFTPADEWRRIVEEALAQGDWVIQQRVEPLPLLGQSGERGTAPHEAVWGLFVFGERYAGGFLSLRPQGESGVINVHQGASEGIILEVLP